MIGPALQTMETPQAEVRAEGSELEAALAAGLSAALSRSEVGLLLVDPLEDRILAASPALAAMTGRDPKTLRGTPVTALFRSALPELITLSEACDAKGRAWSGALAIESGDGASRDVEVFASRFGASDAAGRPRRLAFVLLDAKRQRQRRAKLDADALYRDNRIAYERIDILFRELERGNRLILDAAGEGIYGVNTNGETTFLNPAAERMLGWKAEEMVGRVAHHLMHHTHEAGAEYPIQDCPIYAAFRDGAVRRVDREIFWRKDGTSFPVDYTSTPILDDGRLVGAVVVFRDISKRLEQERQLKQALGEVERLKKRLEMENAYLLDELDLRHNKYEIVGESPAIAATIRQIEMVAPTDATVLITGESGTGKELIARAIHNASDRRDRPLIRVNCAAIPKELFESEFFGHVKGAFTGATGHRVGRFELADGGTIFLDEVGELPLEHQGKLLRVLQDMQFERVGDTRTVKVDVRVIAATNRDLRGEVREKRFREDLYFRLAVFPIESVPLRERPDDIKLLAQLFVARAAERLNRLPPPRLSVANLQELEHYDWPGNIRELENVIERAVIVSRDGRLRFDLPGQAGPSTRRHVFDRAKTEEPGTPSGRVATAADLQQRQRDNIVQALRQACGKVSGPGGAADLLQMKPTTLYSQLKRHGIDARAFKT